MIWSSKADKSSWAELPPMKFKDRFKGHENKTETTTISNLN